MGLETGNTIASLNAAWPLGSDPRSEGDDHLRLIKGVMQNDVVARTTGGQFEGRVVVNEDGTCKTEIGAAANHGIVNVTGADGARLQFDGVTGYYFSSPADTSNSTQVMTRALADARYAPAVPGNLTITGQLAVGTGSIGGVLFDTGTQFYASGSVIVMFVGGAQAARLDPAGTSMGSVTTLVTREKGDARYTLASSDIAMKTAIGDMGPVLSMIQQLQPRTFAWKPNEDDPKPIGTMYGLIAQEVEQVLPCAVRGEEGMKGIDALTCIGVLVKAVQELAAKIEALEAR